MRYLLDTHAFLWWLLDERKLSARQRRVIRTATRSPMLLSDISLWEIATLHELGRVELDLPLRDWLQQAVAPPLIETVRVTVPVAAEVAALPATFHRDLGDRIIVATCRVYRAQLLTGDRRIIDAGLVPTVS